MVKCTIEKQKEYAVEQEMIVSKLEFRVTDADDKRSEGRDDVMRDYARVLYSSPFRRLHGKMQLLGIDANSQ
jgi:dGTPase